MYPGQPRLATFPGIALIAVATLVVRIAAQTPSREYIRLGGRVIAIESPASTSSGVALTVSTSHPGREVTFNGTVRNVPTALNVSPGPVSISTATPQAGIDGERFKYINWTDSSGNTMISTATSFTQTVSAAVDLRVNFQRQVRVQATAF